MRLTGMRLEIVVSLLEGLLGSTFSLEDVSSRRESGAGGHDSGTVDDNLFVNVLLLARLI